ncbi:MAG TPA: MAC/perforin domain-containing protein [Saprospiraceae bacterium]|nr:MAC/perforin domain-containing protein [Saprospiraceae bacterium]
MEFYPSSTDGFDDEGTIELIFKAEPIPKTPNKGFLGIIGTNKSESDANTTNKDESDAIGTYAILSQADEWGTRFVIYLNRSLNRIGLYDGKRFESVPFNFNDGAFHHVAFTTKDGSTSVKIRNKKTDAFETIGTLNIGYGDQGDFPLNVGSFKSKLHWFKGEIYTVRLWKKTLEAADLNRMRFYGLIPETDPLYPELLAYSNFSESEQEMMLAHEPIFKTNLLGSEGNRVVQYLFSDDSLFVGINVQFLGETCGTGLQLLVRENKKDSQFLGPKIQWSEDDPNLADFQSIVFKENEYLTGIGLTNSGGCLWSLRWITNRGSSHLMSGNGRQGEGADFISIPEGTKLVGFEFEIGKNQGEFISGIRMLYKPIFTPDRIDFGIWKAQSHNEPVRDDAIARMHHHTDTRDGGMYLHGNYTSYPLYHLYIDLTTDELVISGELPRFFASGESDDDTDLGKTIGPIRFRSIGGRTYRLDGFAELTFIESNVFQIVASPTFTIPPGIYDYVEPYEATGQDKNEWGGTFTLDQRPVLSEFNFKGYNIAKMDAINYQLTTGASNMVFEWPSEDSYNYYYSTAGKIIPYGLFYKNDRESMTRARTIDVASEREHQQAWSKNLGFNVGFQGMSFGLNTNHQQENKTMTSSKQMYSFAQAHEVKYALIMDKSRMKLSDEFREAVYALRDQWICRGVAAKGDFKKNGMLEGLPFDSPNFQQFIEEFGTHYPYAVSYGGLAYQKVNYTATERFNEDGSSKEVSANAGANLEGATAGFSIGRSDSDAESFKTAMSNQYKDVFTLGGDVSFSGDGSSWSLSDRSEVPIFLDLRPISELLSPIYFDDVIIWDSLRSQLEVALQKYQDSVPLPEQLFWDDIPDMVTYEVQIISVGNLQAPDESDDQGEWSGTISVTPASGSEILTLYSGKGALTFNYEDFPPYNTADFAVPQGGSIAFPVSTISYNAISTRTIGSMAIQLNADLIEADDFLQGGDDECKASINILLQNFNTEWQTGSFTATEVTDFTDKNSGTVNYQFRKIVHPVVASDE